MPDSTGLLPFAERFPGRCIDVGIAEQHAVTAAAGMAMGGLRPVVAVYSTFLTRAFDQVNLDVGLHRQPVIFCLDRAGITGDDGPSHHGVLDMMLTTKVPGMTVFAPSSYQELQQNLHDAMELTDGPVTIRWPKTAARQEPPEQIGHGLHARQLRQGHELCIISVGKMLDACEAAADRLIADGRSVTLWDARVVKPLDPVMLADAANHPCVLTVEDGVREGGVGSVIGDQLAEYTLGGHEPRVRVLGTPIAYIDHAKPDAILADLGLDRDGIMASACSLLAGDHVPHEG
jgi:1-deoxy-D-xylulose-5-phosphate synthase